MPPQTYPTEALLHAPPQAMPAGGAAPMGAWDPPACTEARLAHGGEEVHARPVEPVLRARLAPISCGSFWLQK